jgi:hypothetical protein
MRMAGMVEAARRWRQAFFDRPFIFLSGATLQKEKAMRQSRRQAGRRAGAVLVAALAMAGTGCGVPREAGRLAAAESQALVTPADDAAVRQAMLQQETAWRSLADLAARREFGGITGVDGRFVELVHRAAALAARQRVLIEQGADDPSQNRATLEAFRALWEQTDRYLNP